MIDPVSPLADAFATPPSVEAALARDPVAPRPDSSLGSRHSSLPEAPDPSAVARFRQALALHEDLAAAREAISGSSAAAVPHAESAEAPAVVPHAESAEVSAAARETGHVPEASASGPGFTRESLAAAASATLAQTEALAGSAAALQSAVAPVLEAVSPETLAAAASSALAQSGSFAESAAAFQTAVNPMFRVTGAEKS